MVKDVVGVMECVTDYIHEHKYEVNYEDFQKICEELETHREKELYLEAGRYTPHAYGRTPQIGCG